VGAGFTGLTAAFVLSRRGYSVKVIESDDAPGGLAGTFQFDDGVEVEKFYHHWFNSDQYVPELVEELNLSGDVTKLPSKTGMYLNGRMWNLSTPLDLLKFSALSLWDRVRLGLLVFKVRRISDWKHIEHLSIREWLEPLCGKRVYQVVWEPLVNSKFSVYAEAVNAVWMWKKLVLRGSTRNSAGGEELAYFKGGFGRLARALTNSIETNGGTVSFGDKVHCVNESKDSDAALESLTTLGGERIRGKQFLFTPAFPIIANFFETTDKINWRRSLQRVRYLGNICLVLRLKKSLSDLYWININDPGFPFVGVIEHTNFDAPENYRGSHIVYLSKYLAIEDPVLELL
jgi:protoporphyrinogen oxidase